MLGCDIDFTDGREPRDQIIASKNNSGFLAKTRLKKVVFLSSGEIYPFVWNATVLLPRAPSPSPSPSPPN
jgi:hypothetical protein